MTLFNGIIFAIDLGLAPLKQKTALKELIVHHGGVVALMLTKTVSNYHDSHLINFVLILSS